MRRAILLLVLLPSSAAAQVSFLGARSAALAGATSGLPGDFRGRANPAAWGHVGRWSALVHGAQLYGLPELQYADALLLAPFGSGSAAIGASTFGFEHYRVHTAEVGFGARAAVGTFREISLGVRSTWYLVRIPTYGRAGAASLTTGIHFPVTPFITLGVTAHNVAVRGRLRPDVPRGLSIGASYRPSGAFAVTADLEKDVRAPPSLASGVEISLVPALAIRAGVRSSPTIAAGGVAVRLPHLEFDLTAVRHDVLGWTPSLSVCFTW